MMKQYGYVRLAGLLLALSLLTGCGGSADTTAASNGTSESAPAQAADTLGFSGEAGAVAEAADPDAASDSSAALTEAKLIYTADLSAETTRFEQAAADVEALTAQSGGYIEHSSTSGTAGDRLAFYTLRIPQEQYHTFLDQVGNLCSITHKQEDIQDISEQYFDRETRLTAQTTKRDRLLALLEQATEMDDIISLENALAEVQTEIESLTGALRKYDSLVNFSTITLSLSEVRALSAVAADPSFSSELKLAFVNGCHGLVGFLRGLLLAAASAWPLILIAGIAAVVCVKVLRRRRAKKGAAHSALPDRTNPPRQPEDDTPPEDQK